ncbi:MAG: GNAT family N-acetyltransferase [Methylibium sp.]|nr:GNAT family N-acetyltransferase [Methylibium sp.]
MATKAPKAGAIRPQKSGWGEPLTGEFDGARFYDPIGSQPVAVEPPSRSIPAAINDTVIEFGNAAAGGLGAAANFVAPGNRFSQGVDDFVKMGEASQSDATKAGKKQFRDEVQQAEGIGGELSAVGRYVLDNPVLSAAQAAGSFVGPAAAVKTAKGVAYAGARLFGAAKPIAERAGVAGGLAGGSAAGAAMAGGDAAGTAYELVMRAPTEALLQHPVAAMLAKEGRTEAEIRETLAQAAASDARIVPAVVGGLAGMFGAEKLLANGGRSGSRIATAGKVGAVEASSEALDEGVSTYEGQAAAANYDPNIDPGKGVAAGAGMGAALGGVTGTGLGALMTPLPDHGPLTRAANAGITSGAIQPPPPPPAPPDEQTAQTLLDQANQRAAELDRKAKGTKEETFDGPNGETITAPGIAPQFLTPEEKAELDFLKKNGGDATALAEAYPELGPPPQAAPVLDSSEGPAIIAGAEAAPAEVPPPLATQPDLQSTQPMVARPELLDAFAQREADRPAEPTGEMLPEDILNAAGGPFLNMGAAMRAQKAAGEGHDIVRVAGGLVVRPIKTEAPDGGMAVPPSVGPAASGGAGRAELPRSADLAEPGTVRAEAGVPADSAAAGPADADGVGRVGGGPAVAPDYRTESRDGPSGQSNLTLRAMAGGQEVGRVDFSVMDGEPAIEMVEVPEEHRRKGIGTALVRELQSQYPDTPIKWGMLTDDGAKLKAALPTTTKKNESLAKAQRQLNAAEKERAALEQRHAAFESIESPSPEQTQDHRRWMDSVVERWNELHDEIDRLRAVRGYKPEDYEIVTQPNAGAPAADAGALRSVASDTTPVAPAPIEATADDANPARAEPQAPADQASPPGGGDAAAAVVPAAGDGAAQAAGVARKVPRKVKQSLAEKETQRADYFTPGNVLRGYGGLDRVLEYRPVGARGSWEVQVQRVVKDGDKYVPATNESPRWHATEPDAREVANGPVVRAARTEAIATPAATPGEMPAIPPIVETRKRLSVLHSLKKCLTS